MNTVYLVGGGPGDPGLITVKAKELLARADLIAYDDLIHPKLLEYARAESRLLPVGYRGLRKGTKEAPILHPDIITAAQEGQLVVRLKAGDPTIFGRAWDEFKLLSENHLQVEIVPGITAASGAASSAGLSLTLRGVASGITIETGHLAKNSKCSNKNTRAVYMPKARIQEYCQDLIENQHFCPDTPACYVTSATSVMETVHRSTVSELPQLLDSIHGHSPGLVIIGKAIDQSYSMIATKKKVPLHGKRILVGRMRNSPSQIAGRLRSLGADVIEGPLVSVKPVDEHCIMDQSILNNHPGRIWVFACEPSVDYFLSRLAALGRDIRSFSNPIISLGDRVRSRWEQCGVQVYTHSHGLCDEDLKIHHSKVYNQTLVMPGPKDKRAGLFESLGKWAAAIQHIPCYERVLRPFRILSPEPDLVVVPSSTAVKALCTMDFGVNLKAIPFISIGPKTSAAALSMGVQQVFQSKSDKLDSLIQEVLESEPFVQNQGEIQL